MKDIQVILLLWDCGNSICSSGSPDAAVSDGTNISIKID